MNTHLPGFKKANSFPSSFCLYKRRGGGRTFPLAFAFSGGKKFPGAEPQCSLRPEASKQENSLRTVTWTASPTKPRKDCLNLSPTPPFFCAVSRQPSLPSGGPLLFQGGSWP